MSRSHGAGDSEAGQPFTPNEDSFDVNDGIGLYVVCDGASNAAAGEVASRLAVEAINEFVDSFEGVVEAGAISDTFAARAVQFAFNRVFSSATNTDYFHDMNTTLTLLLVGGNRAAVGHVGDSRLYLVRNNELHQLTVDHPLSNKIVGNGSGRHSDRHVSIDRFTIPIRKNDLFLLCTDGLNPVLEDEAFVIDLAQSRNLRRIVRALLQRAAELHQGADATAVAVRVDDEPSALRLTSLTSSERELVGYVRVAA